MVASDSESESETVSGGGLSVASYMSNKSPPVPSQTKTSKRRILVASDSELESRAEIDSDPNENITKTTRCSRVFKCLNDVGSGKIGKKSTPD